MTAACLVALGILLSAVCLILAARGKTGGAGDVLSDARGFIAAQIDEHIEALARTYLMARPDLGVRQPGPDPFGQQIESFIGDVLLRRAERCEPSLRKAVREVMVLDREYIYGAVLERVQAHLRPPLSAD